VTTPPGQNILVVTDAYPPQAGGSGWSTHALVQQLRAAGDAVDVLMVDSRATGPQTAREFDGIRVQVLPLGEYRTATRHLGARDYSSEPVRRHVAAMLESRPDIRVVHGQHLHSGQGAAIAGRAAGRATLVTVRDCWPTRLDGLAFPEDEEGSGSQREWAQRALVDSFGLSPAAARLASGQALRRLATRQAALAHCHRVICVSEAVRYRIGTTLDIPIDVIPNTIDPATSAAAAGRGELPAGVSPPYLLAAGKLTAIKGFDRIVGELAAARCEWPLVVAGTGPMVEAMRDAATAAGLELILPGWVDGDTLMRLTRDARAVVVPSVCEDALARVILEAMSLATPVVARATGGSPEAIQQGHDGFLYASPDELALALAALRDDAEVDRLGAAALGSCRAKFAPEVVLGRLRASYAAALAEVGQ
jgi:glycosyltransferase involved in cell wall biosynthesis